MIDRVFIYKDLHDEAIVLDVEGPHVETLRHTLGSDWRCWSSWPRPAAERIEPRGPGMWVWEGELSVTDDGDGELRGSVRDIAFDEMWELYLGMGA